MHNKYPPIHNTKVAFYKLAGIKEKIIQQHPNLKDEIMFFIERDPSSNLKYLEWQVKVLKSRAIDAQEIQNITELFHKHSPRLKSFKQKDPNNFSMYSLDLNSYKLKDLPALTELLKGFEDLNDPKYKNKKRNQYDAKLIDKSFSNEEELEVLYDFFLQGESQGLDMTSIAMLLAIKSSSAKILSELAMHSDNSVREAALNNPNYPHHLTNKEAQSRYSLICKMASIFYKLNKML